MVNAVNVFMNEEDLTKLMEGRKMLEGILAPKKSMTEMNVQT